jgi:hypothetical protein
MHTWVRIGEDRIHMIAFYFDLNGTTIKWGCVRNKILKNAAHSETAAPHKSQGAFSNCRPFMRIIFFVFVHTLMQYVPLQNTRMVGNTMWKWGGV